MNEQCLNKVHHRIHRIALQIWNIIKNTLLEDVSPTHELHYVTK